MNIRVSLNELQRVNEYERVSAMTAWEHALLRGHIFTIDA